MKGFVQNASAIEKCSLLSANWLVLIPRESTSQMNQADTFGPHSRHLCAFSDSKLISSQIKEMKFSGFSNRWQHCIHRPFSEIAQKNYNTI